MQISELLENYKGIINEVEIGTAGKSLKIGGENILPYHFFEGDLKNPVRFGLEVYDCQPQVFAESLKNCYSDVINSPVEWAKKSINSYNADFISIYLNSLDEEGCSLSDLAEKVKRIADSINKPVVVYSIGDKDKDPKILAEISKVCSGMNLLLGPVQKDNYEEIGKAALEGGHSIIAQTPLDINLCKELNLKLAKFFPKEKIVIDPLASALGFGIEYSFSIMERVKQIGVIHSDEMMKMPIIANIGRECWKTKEAKSNETQGILWEALSALILALAGANIIIMLHPESLKLLKNVIGVK